MSHAGIAQLVERNLAKVEVASSRLVSRSKFFDTTTAATVVLFLSAGAMAEWLCSGLQIRLGRFDSGLRLQLFLPGSFPSCCLFLPILFQVTRPSPSGSITYTYARHSAPQPHV